MSLKAQVSKWMSSKSALKGIFSFNTSKLHKAQTETQEDSLKDPIPGISTDKDETIDEITKKCISTKQDQHPSDEIKEKEISDHKLQQELFFKVDIKEGQNVLLQKQRENDGGFSRRALFSSPAPPWR